MLTYPAPEHEDALSVHDRVQIAMAIADPTLLQTLLTDALPPIAEPHRIGSIHSKIGVPLAGERAADGLIEFETIHCVLIQSAEQVEQSIADYTDRHRAQLNVNHHYSHARHSHERGYQELIRCESETQTLGQTNGLAQAIALLAESGFSPPQIDAILHQPKDTWYKSWWHQVDPEGQFTVPFLRLIRPWYYIDGRISIQYKDFFADRKPLHFKSEERKVLVEVLENQRGFRKTLEKINVARQHLGVEQALLVCARLSDLEAQAFISQGISLYSVEELTLPSQANCQRCGNSDCALQGRSDSPVVMCRRFCVDSELV
ncbi:MAG: hypothetical protein MUF49_10155 [Oculatellaceae cyanobacterium Prado106]|jgi:hypothetical protein|nr:hypothetical protein [Oculatellaceae cyanobacterium Prado106]